VHQGRAAKPEFPFSSSRYCTVIGKWTMPRLLRLTIFLVLILAARFLFHLDWLQSLFAGFVFSLLFAILIELGIDIKAIKKRLDIE
jgi:hypothetical protein